MLLEALPLLPNGKLDRRALSAADAQGPSQPTAVDPPENELQQLLVDIWSEVLDLEHVGVDTEFESLGGQSFDAAWMLIRVEEEIGVQLPMGELLHARTVRQMADRLEGWPSPERPNTGVTVVQPGAPGATPLWFVHDLHGSAYSARHLAASLPPSTPVLGFESPFLAEEPPPFSRLETLALRYVTQLQRHQPEGPYRLVGYSFGGVLAFEMARQLTQEGAEVSFLGVVDVGPGYRGRHYDPAKVLDKPWMRVPPPAPPDLMPKRRLTYYLDMVKRSPSDATHHLLLRTGLDRWSDEVEFAWDLRRRGSIHPGRRLWFAWRRHWRLARHYSWEGRTYSGPLTLFWAEESASADATMGWGSVVRGKLDIVRIDVAHEAVLQEATAAILGDALSVALDPSK